MKLITKKAFLGYLDCPTKGNMIMNEPAQTLSESDSFRIQQGREIEELAYALFPDGLRVEGKSFADACSQTSMLLSLHPDSTLFEAAVETDAFRARADILVPINGGAFHLIEVKSKTDKTKDLAELHADAAYTSLVFRLAGFVISKISVLVISKDYRLGMPAESLFTSWDITTDVNELVDGWVPILGDIVDACQNGIPSAVGEKCRNCAFFQQGCVGESVANHVLQIPNLRGRKLGNLLTAGIESIENIPSEAELTEKQKVVVESVQLGRPVLTGALADELSNLEWPLCFLDFETVSTALPLYPELAPWTQCVSQFSLHTMKEDGGLHHAEFLAAPEQDCRRMLAMSLLDELGDTGSIIVYSSFERVTLQALAKLYPDLAVPLQSCIDRFVDLLALIRNHYYHPSFQGSYSIKKVLPAMLPTFGYGHLAVADGDMAITQFARMARGELPLPEIMQVRRNLLAYCKQDTWAMVLLLDQLFQIAGLQPILMEEAA